MLTISLRARGAQVSLTLLCFALRLLHQHVTYMPFHDLTTNVVRGGVYGAVAWLSLASLVASLTPDSAQLQQWVLLAVLPVLFAASAYLVYHRCVPRRAPHQSMERARECNHARTLARSLSSHACCASAGCEHAVGDSEAESLGHWQAKAHLQLRALAPRGVCGAARAPRVRTQVSTFSHSNWPSSPEAASANVGLEGAG